MTSRRATRPEGSLQTHAQKRVDSPDIEVVGFDEGS